jgi:hypothetical protein
MRFATGGNTATEERIRITSTGAVGIGTISPAATLDVSGDARFNNQVYAGKNKIINGDMSIAQRGTSVSVGASAYTYTLDRFKAYSVNTATTVSQNTSAPTGFSYSLKLQRPNANTGTNSLAVLQIIETANVMSLQGQSATISFYIKKGANYSGGNITVQGLTGTGTDQGGDPYSFTGLSTFVNDSTYSPTTSFVKVSYTGTVASSVKEIAVAINYTPTGTAGADDAIYITGMQLEQGSVATAFQTSTGSIQGELAACQRYYFRAGANSGGTTNVYSPYGSGYTASTTEAYALVKFPQTMRIAPTTITIGNLAIVDSAGNFFPVSSITYSGANTNGATLYCYGLTSITANRPAVLINNNNTAGFFDASAEL